MESCHPALSLIVPTRGRPESLRRFLASLATTTRRPQQVEIVLVVDSDDDTFVEPRVGRFTIRTVIGPPGRTMGQLNADGYAASRGDHIMLLNDDVIVRTRGWDRIVLNAFRRFPDPVALVHVNDTLIRDYLCTFPIVSRAYCELIGSICPVQYERYRIDDHIQDVFDMLAHVGVRRTVYLPDVIFEHCNSVNHPTAGAVYESDPAILERDAPRFDALLGLRKTQAKRALGLMGELTAGRAAKIDAIEDSFALRVPGRQIVVRAPWVKRVPKELSLRLRACYARAGARGLVRAATRLLLLAH
jgi:hypothetical protein